MVRNLQKKRERIEIWIDREIKTYLVGLHGGVNSSVDDDTAEWELASDCSGVGGAIFKVLLALGLVPVIHSAMSV